MNIEDIINLEHSILICISDIKYMQLSTKDESKLKEYDTRLHTLSLRYKEATGKSFDITQLYCTEVKNDK